MSKEEKIKDLIRKLKAQAKSEFELGHEGAADLFEEKAAELMAKNNLTEADIEVEDKDEDKFVNTIGKTIVDYPFYRKNVKTIEREVWFEDLAKIVADNYGCKTEALFNQFRNQKNEIAFYGYDLDREIATYMFLKIAENALEAEKVAKADAKKLVGKPDIFDIKLRTYISYPKVWPGDEVFEQNFHLGFRDALATVYKVNEKPDVVDFFSKNSRSSYQDSSDILYIKDEFSYKFGFTKGKVALNRAAKNINALTPTKTKLTGLDKDIVYLLLDHSGSMHGYLLDEMKNGAIDFARKSIEKGFAVGVIIFSTYAKQILPPQTVVDDNFVKTINGISSYCDTNMVDALSLAKSYFPSRRNKRIICMVTDGMPSTGTEEATLNEARNCKKDGIKVMAIGVEGARQDFLDKLASEEGLGLYLGSGSRLALGMGEMVKKLN